MCLLCFHGFWFLAPMKIRKMKTRKKERQKTKILMSDGTEAHQLYQSRSFSSQFIAIFNSQLWRFQILQMLKPDVQSPNKLLSTREIKGRAQNLNSILRQYGVSINLIAAGNKNVMDVDLLLKYQLLNTLAFAPADNQLIKRSGFSSVHQVGLGSSVGIFDENLEEKALTMLSSHGLPHVKAKSTGYFLVLVPLIAFCMTSIVGAFCTRVAKDKESEALDESRRHKQRPKSTRWKHALSYSSETDNVVSESAPEDEDEDLFEDAYGKVENDYQKFLSECGISECGYRRGGINQ